MPLDSDIADADSFLNVEFYIRDVKDKVGADGQKVTNFEGKTFVRIKNPGDQTFELDQPATDYHARRFPRHWLAFQMHQQGDANLIGTPLEAWSGERPDELVPDQMRALQVLGFRTVEQIAMASDHQTQRIGMGGNGVRVRAKAFLDSRNRSTRDTELEDTKKRLADMEAMVAKLVQNGSIQADAPVRRAYTRKPKDVSDVHDDDAATGPAGDERAWDTDA